MAETHKMVTVRLSAAEVRRLDAEAKRLRNTRSGVLRLALDRLLGAVKA